MNSEKTTKASKKIFGVIAVFILVLFIVLQVFPFYLSLVTSLQPKSFFSLTKFDDSIRLWPAKISLVNYVTAWKDANLVGGFIWSFIYASSYTLLSCVIMMLTAYVLSKKQFHGREFVFMVFMSALMVPGEILLLSNYVLISDLGLYRTPFAVVLPGLVNIFGIFLARQFMHTIPDSLVESAKIEGAGDIKILFRIMIPLSLSVIATYTIITFTAQWNEYLWPSMVLGNDAMSIYNPVQIRLLLYRPFVDGLITHPYAYTLRLAAMMMTLLPVLVIYFIFQRQFREGITISGMK